MTNTLLRLPQNQLAIHIFMVSLIRRHHHHRRIRKLSRKYFPDFVCFMRNRLVGCEMMKREHLLNLCVVVRNKALAKFANNFISRESRIGLFAQTIKRSKEPEMSNIRFPSDIRRPPFSLCSALGCFIMCMCFEHRPMLLARVRPVLCSNTFRKCVQCPTLGHTRVNQRTENLVNAENRNQARRTENRG